MEWGLLRMEMKTLTFHFIHFFQCLDFFLNSVHVFFFLWHCLLEQWPRSTMTVRKFMESQGRESKMSKAWICHKATLPAPEWVGIQSCIRHPLRPDRHCAEVCASLWEHSVSYRTAPALWTSRSRQGDGHTNGYFHPGQARAEVWGLCRLRGAGRSVTLPREGAFELGLEGWERVARLRRAGGEGRAIQAGCRPLTRYAAGMCIEPPLFGYGRFKFFSSISHC